MKLIFVIAVMLMFAAPLMEETYTWEDAAGTVNFTEHFSSFPAKYHKKARKLGDIGSETSTPAPAAAGETKTIPAVKPTEEMGTNPAGEAGGLFGGRKAEAWQQEMRPLYADVKRLGTAVGRA